MIYSEVQKVHTKHIAMRSALLAVIAALGVSLAAPVVVHAVPRRLTNQDRSVTSTEVKQALQNTAGVLDTSTQTKATSDADSALLATTAGATVDVPKDARQGVQLVGKDGSSLSVSLPNATTAGAAKQVANGVVSYPSTGGSANAVQTNADGSVRMLTVIDNPNAPTRYDYKVSLPTGGQVVITSNGGALILDKTGKPAFSVDVPWAKDAHQRPIKTWFKTDGRTLTQIVKHNVSGVSYPVTADPNYKTTWFGTYIFFTSYDTQLLAIGATAALGARIGGGVAAAISAAGGQWLADQAKKRHKCLATFRPHGTMWYQLYVTNC